MASSDSDLVVMCSECDDSLVGVRACLTAQLGSNGECRRSVGLVVKKFTRFTIGSSFFFSLAHNVHLGGVRPFLSHVCA